MAIPSSRFVPSSLSGSSTYTTTPKIIGPIIVYVVLVGDPGLLVIFSLDLIKTKQVQVKPFTITITWSILVLDQSLNSMLGRLAGGRLP